MNRRTFGKLSLLGAMAALTKGANAQAQPAGSDERAKGAGAYKPTLKSIGRHTAPEWFHDAKFGMFIDYGLYSVAGYAPMRESGAMYPDWYLYNMYNSPEVAKYHRAKWGEDFQRDDFIPLFTAENFDPGGIAGVADDAGMRYVVPFCKHHDGFCLWPSSYTRRNAAEMGPKRDLIGPLSEACRGRGLKFGFYFSLEEWEYPVIQGGGKMVRIWTTLEDPTYQTVPFDEKAMAGKITGKVPVRDFVADYIIPQATEFIDRYDPDILWLDGDWTTFAEELGSRQIVSYFYNQASGRKTVASNDRLGRFMRFNSGDFFTSEYGSRNTERAKILHKWEECRGVSQSFGYNWQDTEKNVTSTGDLIDMLVGIVSENGNLLLVVNLDGKGAMPAYIRDRLHDVGRWLKVNGEAIYRSRPWLVASQGDRLRFTRSKDDRYLYAIHKGWPEADVELHDLWLDSSSRIVMLGTGQDLKWRNVPEGKYGRGGKVAVEIPQLLKGTFDSDHAVTLRIELTD
ncbi:MAG TPA: alpha-L-fucosidase [Opitutaceae bacterium]|nr:alpha-L-fucosidase [Opitutaceae bacterium]